MPGGDVGHGGGDGDDDGDGVYDDDGDDDNDGSQSRPGHLRVVGLIFVKDFSKSSLKFVSS